MLWDYGLVSEDYRVWWNRLTPDERRHTRWCASADDVDEEMLQILRRHGPVGVYGVRWVGETRTLLSGPFIDFVNAQPG